MPRIIAVTNTYTDKKNNPKNTHNTPVTSISAEPRSQTLNLSFRRRVPYPVWLYPQIIANANDKINTVPTVPIVYMNPQNILNALLRSGYGRLSGPP